MRTIRYIIQKEFIQIFRNKTMLPVIFLMPILQLLVLVFAATLEMKQIQMLIVDYDLSSQSLKLGGKFRASPFFHVHNSPFSLQEAEVLLKSDKADIILHIPSGFEKNRFREAKTPVQLLINAINGNAAGLIQVYATSVIADFNKEPAVQKLPLVAPMQAKSLDISPAFWYNPQLNYKIYMLPGILVILVTIVGMFLTALNLVREKEMGTIEQINVSPIKKYQFITGKLFPFWCIALFELAFGLAIGKLLFNIPMLGSLPLLFGFAALYLCVMLGTGLFISTLSSTQQQVMFIAFFIMIVCVMMSGMFTPTESMPYWAQQINRINPMAYFMRVIRMILLKGSTFGDIWQSFLSLSIYAVVVMALSIRSYRKTA